MTRITENPHVRTVLRTACLLSVCALCMVPITVQANYTWFGRQFESHEELVHYLKEYLRAWRSVYGVDEVVQDITTSDNERNNVEVTTSFVRDIAHDGARLLGKIDLRDFEYAEVWFEYGRTAEDLTRATEYETIHEDDGTRTFDRKIRLLEHDTLYYYRAVAESKDGVRIYGKVRNFRTDVDVNNTDSEVKIRTNSAVEIDDNRATLRGQINFNDSTYALVWFTYGESEGDLEDSTSKMRTEPGDTKSFERTIRRLTQEQEYFFRAVGSDSNGIKNFGKLRTFKTKRDIVDEKPKVTTERAENIDLHTATLTGMVDMNDFRNGIVFFVYGEDREEIRDVASKYDQYRRIREFGDDRQKLLIDEDLDRDREYKVTVDDLDLDTRHYFAIGVEYEDENNDEVLTLGSIRTFTTRDVR